MRTRSSPRLPAPAVTLALALLLGACGAQPGPPPVACEARHPADALPTASDTLDVLVRVDAPPRRTRILVRVDPLDEEGSVLFRRTPSPTTAAVGMALTPAAVFQGCLDRAPSGFVLRTPRLPEDKAWLRISAGRPVRVRLAAGPEPGDPTTLVVVEPGASGRATWTDRGVAR